MITFHHGDFSKDVRFTFPVFRTLFRPTCYDTLSNLYLVQNLLRYTKTSHTSGFFLILGLIVNGISLLKCRCIIQILGP